jgi:hypothetical protein
MLAAVPLLSCEQRHFDQQGCRYRLTSEALPRHKRARIEFFSQALTQVSEPEMHWHVQFLECPVDRLKSTPKPETAKGLPVQNQGTWTVLLPNLLYHIAVYHLDANLSVF